MEVVPDYRKGSWVGKKRGFIRGIILGTVENVQQVYWGICFVFSFVGEKLLENVHVNVDWQCLYVI